MWVECKRIIKPNGAMIFFSQMPFTAKLAMSNIKQLKYEWIWHKPMATGFLNAHYAPMKCHENILVFSDGAAAPVKDKTRNMPYYPQFLESQKKEPYVRVRDSREKKTYGNFNACTSESADGSRYPRDVITFKHPKDKVHPTAKPVDLLEYLIKTYTLEGETVLDFCMGAGSCGIAAINTNRNFIGIELEKKYFDIAEDKINGAKLMLDK